jgi:hypothetical protein
MLATSETIFNDLIYPYGKKDTINNAKIIIENIKTQKHFETVIIKCVNYNSKVILKSVLQEIPFEKFKNTMKNDTILKIRLINNSLSNQETQGTFELICKLFDTIVPQYTKLSDIIFCPDRYDEEFINTKTNVNYLTDIEKNITHFENYITDMRSVYAAGEDLTNQSQNKLCKYECENAFNYLLEQFNFTLDQESIDLIKEFAIEYYNFIKNDFDNIIQDIKNNEEKPDSKTDTYGLLYSYLGRDPSHWERDILWDHTCDTWAYENENESENEN